MSRVPCNQLHRRAMAAGLEIAGGYPALSGHWKVWTLVIRLYIQLYRVLVIISAADLEAF